LRDLLHRRAVKVGAILDQLDHVEHRLARRHSNDAEEHFRAEAVAFVEDCESHGSTLFHRSL
jgi:hypothetical protein